jgi:hypothetical protein
LLPFSITLVVSGSPLQKLLFSLRISQGLLLMSVDGLYEFGPFRRSWLPDQMEGKEKARCDEAAG